MTFIRASMFDPAVGRTESTVDDVAFGGSVDCSGALKRRDEEKS